MDLEGEPQRLTAIDHSYRYAFESRLETSGARPRLQLATSGGVAPNPFFFQGKLLAPELSAQLLFTLSRVVGSRFHVPPAMLAKIVALADPVVTCGGGMLRFEGFSSCASAYGRVDFTPEAYAGDVATFGTTNVDFNAPMKATLASVRERDGLDLSVGREELRLSKGEKTVVERKVALPVRWLKGLVEVQAYASRMTPFARLGATDALRFIRALPRSAGRQKQWLVSHKKSVRLTHTKSKGALRIGGIERLRVLEPLLVRCKGLVVHADANGQASAWQLEFGPARFTLALSADVWRGFSGEGQVLDALRTAKQNRALALEVRAALNWQAELVLSALAERFQKTEADIANSLAILGSRGLVGFDQHAAAYFHRELPFDLGKIEDLAPRLKSARALVEKGALRLSPEDPRLVLVASGGVEHRVELLENTDPRCTCPWYAKHQGTRGPCKHVLAAESFLETRNDD